MKTSAPARDRRGTKPRLGISACLLGRRVRYDGGHKLDRALRDALGEHVEFVPVCPETECGLGVPREPMKLAGSPEAPVLRTRKGGIDLAPRLRAWTRKRIEELECERLCGFVFKSRSPSCGPYDAKVHDSKGDVAGTGAGIFAKAFMDRFPGLPVADENHLRNPSARRAFLKRLRAGFAAADKRPKTRTAISR